MDKIDPDTRKPILDSEGKTVKEEKEVTVPAFKVVTVFDISQTEGKEFPDLSVKTAACRCRTVRGLFRCP